MPHPSGKRPRAIVLAGPTASGKSDLAMALAQKFPIEIVGADSLQVFRHMDIGSAKPSTASREQVPHHMIDELNPDEEANAAWYSEHARAQIEKILEKGHIPLIVGGCGFYLRALEYPPLAPPSGKPQFPSAQEMLEKIHEVDPKASAAIHFNDRYRIERAYQLALQGIAPSQVWEQAAAQEPKIDIIWLGIQMDREELYIKANERMNRMFRKGLVNETSFIRAHYPASCSRLRKAIGYREALEYIEGRLSLTEAKAYAQRATRRYAKRQLTWFRKETRMQWLGLETAELRASEIISRTMQ